jgi:glucokinase
MTIGIDLGGTNLRAGIVQNGKIIQQRSTILLNKDSLSESLSQLKSFIAPMINSSIQGIGVGVPSVVDVENGIVFNVMNISSWKKVELKDILQKEFNVPVHINNDVNCFILGEHKYGLARPYRSVVGIAMGTGLGMGIIIHNKLYMGNNCGAGEIGLLPYLEYNFEYYCSSNFFEVIHKTSALDAHLEASNGSAKAKLIWDEFGSHIGNVIKAVVYTYDPEAIILGGSIAKAFDFFSNSMRKIFDNFCYPESIKRLKILQSEDDAITLLGAAALVK